MEGAQVARVGRGDGARYQARATGGHINGDRDRNLKDRGGQGLQVGGSVRP
jgi:hypothetical protein